MPWQQVWRLDVWKLTRKGLWGTSGCSVRVQLLACAQVKEEEEESGLWRLEKEGILSASWIVKLGPYLTFLPKQSCQIWPQRGDTRHTWANILGTPSLTKALLYQMLMQPWFLGHEGQDAMSPYSAKVPSLQLNSVLPF